MSPLSPPPPPPRRCALWSIHDTFHLHRASPSAPSCGRGMWCVRWRFGFCQSYRRRRRWSALPRTVAVAARRVSFATFWPLCVAPRAALFRRPPLTALVLAFREECLLVAFRSTGLTDNASVAAAAVAPDRSKSVLSPRFCLCVRCR